MKTEILWHTTLCIVFYSKNRRCLPKLYYKLQLKSKDMLMLRSSDINNLSLTNQAWLILNKMFEKILRSIVNLQLIFKRLQYSLECFYSYLIPNAQTIMAKLKNFRIRIHFGKISPENRYCCEYAVWYWKRHVIPACQFLWARIEWA